MSYFFLFDLNRPNEIKENETPQFPVPANSLMNPSILSHLRGPRRTCMHDQNVLQEMDVCGDGLQQLLCLRRV